MIVRGRAQCERRLPVVGLMWASMQGCYAVSFVEPLGREATKENEVNADALRCADPSLQGKDLGIAAPRPSSHTPAVLATLCTSPTQTATPQSYEPMHEL